MKILLFSLLVFVFTVCIYGKSQDGPGSRREITNMKFLVAVNCTWDPQGCLASIATDWLKPSKSLSNLTQHITVANCDSGPFQYNVTYDTKNMTNMMVHLVFHSSVIEDASPPVCHIPFSGNYLLPSNSQYYFSQGVLPSLLPGCFVMDSREGYHMTYYWFYILDWMWRV